MVELDRLVRLLIEKMLRSSKKQDPKGDGADEGKVAGNESQQSVAEEPAKERTDKKMPEG